jgi:cell division protein FtsB
MKINKTNLLLYIIGKSIAKSYLFVLLIFFLLLFFFLCLFLFFLILFSDSRLTNVEKKYITVIYVNRENKKMKYKGENLNLKVRKKRGKL